MLDGVDSYHQYFVISYQLPEIVLTSEETFSSFRYVLKKFKIISNHVFLLQRKIKKHLKKAHLEIHCVTVVLDYDVYLLYIVLFIYFNLQI